VSIESVATWLVAGYGLVAMFVGLSTLVAECSFRIRWKWGDFHQMRHAARLGWNTGAPPDGSMFLVLEFAEQIPKKTQSIYKYKWAVMRRYGDTCHSINGGGLSMPVTNVTGWLEIVESPQAAVEATRGKG